MKLKQANKQLVKNFIRQGDIATHYDFKCENEQLKGIKGTLDRTLYFKKEIAKNHFDPDKTDLTMSIMCTVLEMKGCKVLGYEDRRIYLEDDTILETDTAHSFISLYKGALMTALPNYWDIMHELNIKGGFSENICTIYNNRDRFSLRKIDSRLMNEIYLFSSLTHSIGNFIIGPLTFNSIDPYSKAKLYSPKNWQQFDRIDLFLQQLAQNKFHPEWKEWFEVNIAKLYYNYYFENLVYKNDGRVDLKSSKLISLDKNNLTERLYLTNEMIVLRGTEIIRDLQNYLL